MIEKKAVNIFWTGGWDSTFRLLQLIVSEKKNVQPYYIIDPTRRSTEAEINAMKSIRALVISKFPYSKKLLKPTITVNLDDIDRNQDLTPNLARLAKSFSLGGQYAWLASYCEVNNIHDMELSIQKPGSLYDILNDEIKLFKEGNDEVCVMDDKTKYNDLYTLLKYYSFPILQLTKPEMLPIAEKSGFSDLLDLTWFCHNPRMNNSTCGMCNPCITAIKQGLGRKVSFGGHLRYQLFVRTGLKNLRMKYAG